MEVISINGPGFGLVTCPPGWTRTPKGNCGGPPPRYYSDAAAAVQKALRALGARAKDSFLTAIRVDGVIGGNTRDAINKAFTQHIGEGSAPAAFRSGTLSVEDIAKNALILAIRLNEEVLRRGGAPVPVPPPQAPRVNVGPAEMLPPAPSSTRIWALVGLNLLVAGIGGYCVFSSR